MKNRSFTIDQYIKMSDKFNKMLFIDKIKAIQENSDILTLASDCNWWAVNAKDSNIQFELECANKEFRIENEWDHNQIYDLISLLGIDNTDI